MKSNRTYIIFVLSVLGVLVALTSAYYATRKNVAQSPVFAPAADPYGKGIYAEGIIESDQDNGANVNIYPEVPGKIVNVLVHEGDDVKAGQTLVQLDSSVQQGVADQAAKQAAAAGAQLQELKAEPRRETLAVAEAQLAQAKAALKTAQDEYEKQGHAAAINPKAVSQDVLDNARNAYLVAQANQDVASRQLKLVAAGAWSYDIDTQQHQYDALTAAAKAASALLQKYTIVSPVAGKVMALNGTSGSYVTSQGIYDTYTQGNDPLVVMSTSQQTLAVRCYIDEILIHGLPKLDHVTAEMTIRGSDFKIPLQFVRIQPYVSPKIELSDERQEQVDLRVLPLVFRFNVDPSMKAYPGELVDIYIKQD